MPNSITGQITANGQSIVLPKGKALNKTKIQVSGTFSLSIVIEGSVDGTNYYPIAATKENDGSAATGTLTPTTGVFTGYDIQSEGFSKIRVRSTAWTSGTMDVYMEAASYVR